MLDGRRSKEVKSNIALCCSFKAITENDNRVKKFIWWAKYDKFKVEMMNASILWIFLYLSMQ